MGLVRTRHQPTPGLAASTLPGRHRNHLFPARPRRLTPRFSDAELAAIAAAAAAVGVTPTGFCADAALAAARQESESGGGRQDRQALAVLQRQLFDAATALTQTAAALAAHEPSGPRDAAVAACLQVVEHLDEVAARVDRTLR